MTHAPTQLDASRWEEMARAINGQMDLWIQTEKQRGTWEANAPTVGQAYYASLVVAAFAQVAAEVREAALEEAAVESESWFEMFKFESFALDDMRRCANPNQIAARIRALKCPTKLSDGSDQ